MEAQIIYHQGLLDYEGDTLSESQKDKYKVAIKAAEEQIKTNRDYVRYVEPLI